MGSNVQLKLKSIFQPGWHQTRVKVRGVSHSPSVQNLVIKIYNVLMEYFLEKSKLVQKIHNEQNIKFLNKYRICSWTCMMWPLSPHHSLGPDIWSTLLNAHPLLYVLYSQTYCQSLERGPRPHISELLFRVPRPSEVRRREGY